LPNHALSADRKKPRPLKSDVNCIDQRIKRMSDIMSIVICAVPYCTKLYLASDKRAIRNGKVSDDFKKTYNLRKDVYYSITGTAEPGIWYFDRLKKRPELPINDLISWCDKDFDIHSFPTLTIMISGKDENGNFFIWQKNDSGEVTNADISTNVVAFSISSTKNMPLFNQYFTQQLVNRNSIENTIANTINMASTIDETISSSFDMVIVA
jgi:hypothetical protein